MIHDYIIKKHPLTEDVNRIRTLLNEFWITYGISVGHMALIVNATGKT